MDFQTIEHVFGTTIQVDRLLLVSDYPFQPKYVESSYMAPVRRTYKAFNIQIKKLALTLSAVHRQLPTDYMVLFGELAHGISRLACSLKKSIMAWIFCRKAK